MNSYHKLGKNVVLMFIGSFGSRLLSFLFVPFYTSVLSTDEYGTADLITTTVTLLLPFFTLIISESMMRFALDKENDKESVFFLGILVWLVGTAVFLCLSPIILLISTLKPYIILVILYYVSYSIHNVLSYYVRGIEKILVYSISGIINTALVIALNLIFLLAFNLGIQGYLLSFIIANFITAIFLVIASSMFRYKFTLAKIDKSLLKKMLNYSIPMIPNSISWWISNSSDRYILTYFCGTAVNGIYAVASKIPSIISTVSTIFMSAWRLSAVENFGSEESEKFFSHIFSLYVTLTVGIMSILLVLNKPLAHLLYANDFYQAWAFVPILLFASILHSYSDFFGTIYTSAYKTRMLFYSTVAGAILNIVMNFLMIPTMGAYGAAIATLLSYAIVLIIRMIHSRRFLKIKYDIFRSISTLVLITIQTGIALFDFQYDILCSLFIGILLLLIHWKNVMQLINIYVRPIFARVLRRKG